jgi:PPK2 family polyphosphate:nucleotide phosphotransferase
MIDSLRARPGFQLARVDPASTPGFENGKRAAEKQLAAGIDELSSLQERLFADSRFGGKRSVLLVLQAMDTAGKGGIVRHVVGGVDPQGVKLHAFKKPTDEELAHDFLWRVRKEVPPAGYIGVFDRSHYEDVLIHRVHLFSPLVEINKRYALIDEFERELVDAGTTIIKVMLHISADEQRERLVARLDRDDKHWKYNPGDVDERAHWAAYQEAYQIAIERTSTDAAPWYVVPADNKWYARLAVQELLLDALRSFDLGWPDPPFDVDTERARLAAG